MKFTTALVVIFLASSAPTHAALQFAGYLTTPHGSHFCLVDDDHPENSSWVTLGQSFAGQTVSQFHAQRETLVVTSPSGPQTLSLHPSPETRLRVAGTIHSTSQDLPSVIRTSLAIGEHNRLPLTPDTILNIKPVRADDGSLKYLVLAEISSNSGSKKILAGPTVRAVAGRPVTLKVAGWLIELAPAT